MAEEIPTITREQYNQIMAGSGSAPQEAEIPTITRAQYNELIGGSTSGPKFDFGPQPGQVSDAGGMMNQAGQGMLAGFGDEIGAGIDALYNTGSDWLAGRNQDVSVGQQYDAALQGRRGAEKEFKKQSPWLAGGAELAGAIGSPINLMMPGGGGIKGAATTGARLGALSGIGASEGGAEDRLKGGAYGGAIGGAMGGAVGLASKILGGAGSFSKTAGEKLQAGSIGATKTDFKASARYGGLIPDGEGGKTTKLMESIKNVIDDGTFKGVSPGDSSEMIFANSGKIDTYDNTLTQILNKADEVAQAKGIQIQPTFTKAQEFVSRSNPLEKAALEKEFADAKDVLSGVLDGSLTKMQEVKRSLYRSVYSENGRAKQELATALATDLKNSIEKGAESIGDIPGLGSLVKSTNAKMGQHLEVEKLLARRLAQEQGDDAVKSIMGQLRTSGGNLTTPALIGSAMGGPGGGKAGFWTGLAISALKTPTGKMKLGEGLRSVSPFLASEAQTISKIGKPLATLSGKLGSQQGGSMDNPEIKAEAQQMEQPAPQTKTGEIDPALIQAIIQTESAGNPKAVSPAGAKGLMQLMPAMAKAYGVDDPFDPEQNVRGGTALLQDELRRFGGDLRLALAAYNAGSPAVMRAINKAESADFEVIKQYLPTETQNYVPKVMKIYGV